MEYKKYLVGVGLSSMLILSACNSDGEELEDYGGIEVDEKDNGNNEVDEYKEEVEETREEVVEDEGSETEEEVNEDSIGIGFNHTPKEAIDFSKENFKGELTQLDIEMEDNEWVYKVKLENNEEEYEVELSVNNLSILEEDREDDGDAEDTFNYEDLIPYDEAIQIAMEEGDGEFKELQLDKDDNIVRYDIELTNGIEVEINAETGEILEVD